MWLPQASQLLQSFHACILSLLSVVVNSNCCVSQRFVQSVKNVLPELTFVRFTCYDTKKSI